MKSLRQSRASLNIANDVDSECTIVDDTTSRKDANHYMTLCDDYHIAPEAPYLIALKAKSKIVRFTSVFNDGMLLPVAESLYSNTHVTHLDFSSCCLHVNAAVLLQRVLERNKNIVSVNLENSKIGTDGMRALCRAFRKNNTLKELNISDNNVLGDGLRCLAQTIRKHSHLRFDVLDVSNNHAGFDGTDPLCQVIKATKYSTKLNFDGNYVLEETLNSLSHFVGLLFGIVGAIFLIYESMSRSRTHVFGCTVFSLSIIFLYSSSTLFHSCHMSKKYSKIFQVLDHSGVYMLIAGSYTPIMLIILHNKWSGIIILFVEWTCAIVGITYKCVSLRPGVMDAVVYALMAWQGAFVMNDVAAVLPWEGSAWIVGGGLIYTSGIAFYALGEKYPIYHTAWHLFVIGGTLCHYIAILVYVLPVNIASSQEVILANDGLMIK